MKACGLSWKLKFNRLSSEIKKRELDTLLSGQYDQGNALLTINSGSGRRRIPRIGPPCWSACTCAGPKDAAFTAEILDVSEGEEAGIKSVTIAVNGQYAYGYLRPEKGVHRLVRLSPFDAAHRRHTSFAQVEVLPKLPMTTPFTYQP